ncbi:MAG: ABC transporter ATP-binding protein [Thermofilaceae archaeon]
MNSAMFHLKPAPDNGLGDALAAIEVKNLSFRYLGKSEPALKNITLEVKRGEVVLLAGRSGSGKSTLIKCVNGLIPHRYEGVYEGEVKVDGLSVPEAKLSQISKVVGTIMQEVGKQLVLPTVIDDVAFGLCNLCLDRETIENKVEEALSRLGIAHLRNRDVNELSGGEKQRVAIAGVLAMNPSIVLMDEPLANLDSEGVRLTQQLIRELKAEKRTLLVAEHRVEEVLDAGVDRVFIMEQGMLVKEVEDAQELAEFAGTLKLPASIFARSGKTVAVKELAGQTAGKVAVEFRNVSFSYDDRPVLRNINLVIREGERVALLGNNGAGKSTIAKLIIGILKPTSGEVRVYGMDTRRKDVYDLAPIVGLVFQDPFNMLFARTVREELSFGPLNLRVPADEIPARVKQAAASCRIEPLLEYSPFASSHGEKKRICVGSILAMKPKILILDEPTAGQDYASCTSFMEFINRLISDGIVRTLILITHDTDLAVEYTDRTVVLANGEIVAEGPTRRLLADSNVLLRGKIRETSLIRVSRELTGGAEVLRLGELLSGNL